MFTRITQFGHSEVQSFCPFCFHNTLAPVSCAVSDAWHFQPANRALSGRTGQKPGFEPDFGRILGNNPGSTVSAGFFECVVFSSNLSHVPKNTSCPQRLPWGFLSSCFSFWLPSQPPVVLPSARIIQSRCWMVSTANQRSRTATSRRANGIPKGTSHILMRSSVPPSSPTEVTFGRYCSPLCA
jgi:hypothetical protein